ncbi:hypothetical protein PS914_05996 [Pseudomonas fluorescens]|uniref:hypothetical protein n=1 Tax=Pseudomonas fluorescens TaxID=294 RepID=UPI001251FC96|nr:hypothetical protein [Pseudomonas fluorescens]VVQ17323.1 hypothetical protein PS914_05996 [Pseudomonas fluorescens]
MGKVVRALKSFWFVSTLAILIAFFFAVYLYRLKFGGSLSSNSSDWSNFGSYIGGVFGPLVSFVTLLAVLKTVYLQRELLDIQRDEFKSMQDLQRETLDSQLEQFKQAAEVGRQDQYHRTLEHLLNMIDRHSVLHGNIVERLSSSLETLAIWAFEGRPVKKEQLVEVAAKNERHKRTITGLTMLAVDLSQISFATTDELREFYRSEMQKIFSSESDEGREDAAL